jgi:DNA-binding transcriptional ArsR family regulator
MILSLIIFWGISLAQAQSPDKIEKELLISFRQLQQLAAYNDGDHMNNHPDSIKQANNSFRNSLLAYTAADRSTFTYDFKELEKEGLVIRTSEDGQFRIYSWDTRTGGADHVFDAVYQYRAGNNVFSKAAHYDEDGDSKWYSNIYTLKTDTQTYYLGLYHEMHSSTSYVQGIKIFCIDRNQLNETVRLMKTSKGIANEIAFAYNFLSVAKRPERPAKLIYYDTDDDRLHLTIVKDDGTVTRQIITYQFTGKYFELVKGR